MTSPKSKVTKHPGRIEAGKRLAEWNRQRKYNQQAKEALKSPEQDAKIHFSPSIDNANKQQQSCVSHSPSYDFKMISAAVVAGSCYLVYRLYNKYKVKPHNVKSEKVRADKEQPVEEQLPKNPVYDPFNM